MTYNVEQLKAWAAEGVAAWQRSMPAGVTLSAQVPDADAAFFTVVRGNEGAAIQVPAGRMRDPGSWESAAVWLLNRVQRDQLWPLQAGRVSLTRMRLPEAKSARREDDGPLSLQMVLPDPAVRQAALGALRSGRAHLELRGRETWYVSPSLGLDVRVRHLQYDPELGLVARPEA